MRRIVSVWLPRFATERIRRRQAAEPAPPSGRRAGAEAAPLVTARVEAGRCLIVAVDAAGLAGGLHPGQPLADARALAPALRVLPADPVGDAQALARLAAWCDRYTPLVAIEATESGCGAGLWLDVTGCAHLCGGETELLADLAGRLARLGHQARLGLADTPGAAWAAARFLPAVPLPVVAPGGAQAVLAPLPVAALRLPPALVAGLDRLGLRRVGELYPLPRAALARRFGRQLGDRLDQALGALAEPISPRLPVPPDEARLGFAEPLAHREGLAGGLAALLERLCRRLEEKQQGARRLTLTLHRVDGTRQHLAIGTSRPSRDPAALGRLFAEHLERIDPGFGVEVMALAAPLSERLSALQIVLGRLPPPRPAAAVDPPALAADADLAPLLDRLGNRLGFSALGRPAPRLSHLPEQAATLAPPLAPARTAWPATAPRPLRLLSRPEPVAAEPGTPPAWFDWRGRRRRIARAEGPERIAAEWWRRPAAPDGPGERDYYRLEDADGRRFWLYRETGAAPARWYLHGLFA
jgi:protein ImuB